MSVRRLRIVFASNARRDLRSILLYTGKEWGEEQRTIYGEANEMAF
jgi:plasmid stabilization system protein ParE